VGALRFDDGTVRDLGIPQIVNYSDAEKMIVQWQADHTPTATIILLDQPTIVKNPSGQRPVENIVSSPVSRRYGGMQPANTARLEMFGEDAPMWPFLDRFGGPANPFKPAESVKVFETYPVLTMIALDWTLPDSRVSGRLPKYNPQRRKTFSISDWQFVCRLMSEAFRERQLPGIAKWIENAAQIASPRKHDQDGLDACLCLMVALDLVEEKDCLMVGNLESGYIVVPHGIGLRTELSARCDETGRVPSDWVRLFRLVESVRR
jgi:predicted RNase H-like nuclease